MSSSKVIRIGTRESALALYQAREVQSKFNKSINTEIIKITSDGDIDLQTPLYEMGIQGIFTKSLDSALLNGEIDVAVHSAKDIPTKLAKGLIICALLERGTTHDCLVLPAGIKLFDGQGAKVIASSSLRRRSQWLHRYPHHQMENLRGNIQTRLKKIDASNWNGAIFAQAAIERLNITSHHFMSLDWMLPAPAQGAMAVVCREEDEEIIKICEAINHKPTEICVTVERNFLASLQGGCAVPIAANARLEDNKIHLRGNIFSLDGTQKSEVDLFFELEQAKEAGKLAAVEVLRNNGESILKTFRSIS